MIYQRYLDSSRLTPQKQENRKNSLLKNNNNFSDGTKNFITFASLSLFLLFSLIPTHGRGHTRTHTYARYLYFSLTPLSPSPLFHPVFSAASVKPDIFHVGYKFIVIKCIASSRWTDYFKQRAVF